MSGEYARGLIDAAELAEKWRDENRKASAEARRHGNDSMADRLDGSATECHALAGELRTKAAAA